MYFVTVILLLLVLPIASVATQAVLSHHTLSILFLTGRWFAFWAVGVRLFIAGVRQVVQPRFTAEEIFEIHDLKALVIVRELGFANLSMGLLGLYSLVRASWIVPGALVGGLYYGFAGIGHVIRDNKNAKEQMAMISDLLISLLLLIVVWKSLS
jgi:hypothetical protein